MAPASVAERRLRVADAETYQPRKNPKPEAQARAVAQGQELIGEVLPKVYDRALRGEETPRGSAAWGPGSQILRSKEFNTCRFMTTST